LVKLPTGEYHNVYTISSEPSCYLYIYINETSFFHTRLYDVYLSNMLPLYEQVFARIKNDKSIESSGNLSVFDFSKSEKLEIRCMIPELLKTIKHLEAYTAKIAAHSKKILLKDNLAYTAYELTVENHSDELFVSNLTNTTLESNPTFNVDGVLKLLSDHQQDISKLKKFYTKNFYYHIRDNLYRENRSFFKKAYHKLISNLYTFQRR
jgi:hypothetical protein